jgi:hypothetical protein
MPPDERLSMADQLGVAWDKMEKETTDASDISGTVADRSNAAGSDGSNRATEDATADTVAADRARDEAGRFKAEEKSREKLTLKPKEAKDATPKQEREAPREGAGKETGLVEPAGKVGNGIDQPSAQDAARQPAGPAAALERYSQNRLEQDSSTPAGVDRQGL